MHRKEIWRRLCDASLLSSKARDAWLDAWNLCVPGPFARIYRKVRPYTMCGHARLRGLYQAIHEAVAEHVPGDVVECGAARGGSAALMGLALKQLGTARTVWVCDTFEGLPPPTETDPDRDLAMPWTGLCRGELGEVQELFRRLGILSGCRLVKGLFQDTLPTCGVRAIALLHLDCDWYDSVKACLDHLYDRVSPGGIIQFDDYGHWAGARKAVDDFFRHRAIELRLRRLDYAGRQFVKPFPA